MCGHSQLRLHDQEPYRGAPLLPDLIAWADESRGYVYGGFIDKTFAPGKVVYRFNGALPNIGAGALEVREETDPDDYPESLPTHLRFCRGATDRTSDWHISRLRVGRSAPPVVARHCTIQAARGDAGRRRGRASLVERQDEHGRRRQRGVRSAATRHAAEPRLQQCQRGDPRHFDRLCRPLRHRFRKPMGGR